MFDENIYLKAFMITFTKVYLFISGFAENNVTISKQNNKLTFDATGK